MTRPIICTGVSAKTGDLESLRYAHEHGAPWHQETTGHAADHGQLECLRYAHENGAPWDERTTEYAAWNGHLACLRYAHEHGAPWHRLATSATAENGHLACLRYAYFRGCPWNESKHASIQSQWNRAASTIGRAWRRHRDAKRRMAVSVIEAAWLAHTYAPGGKGYARLAVKFRLLARPKSCTS
jgi:hypothetical protein